AWWGLAKLYLLQGKFTEAEKYSQKLVDAGDDSAKELLDAAKAKKLDDNLKNMISPAAAASQPAENSATARGWKLFNQGRFVDAVKEFEAAIKENPTDANARNGMGWACLRSRQAGQAKAQFEEALKLDPDAAGA